MLFRSVHGDTDIVPWDIGAFASHTTYMVGRAAQMAASQVRQQVLERAAERLEVAVEDLEARLGVIAVRGVPAKCRPVTVKKRECS